MSKTTLSRAVPAPNFQYSLAEYLRDFAERTQKAFGAGAKKHAAALADVHNYVASLDGFYDPRLVALYELHLKRHEVGESGAFDRWEFIPTENQKRLLATLGHNAPPPPATTTLDELVMAGVVDTIEQLSGLRGKVENAQRVYGELQAELDREREAHAETAAELDGARGEIAQAREERQEAVSDLEFLKSFVADDAFASSQADERKKSRRTRVEGHTGIYVPASGEGYEALYTDENGKTAYVRDLDTVEEAVAAREQAKAEVAKRKAAVPA